MFSGRLKFLVLPLAHLFLQQEETPPCVAHRFLLIPLIMLPDHSHNPGQSLPLTVPAHLAVMEYSLSLHLFLFPSSYLRLLPSLSTLTHTIATEEDKQTHD